MKPIQTLIILALGLLASAGCSWQSMCHDFVKLSPADCLQYRNCPQAQSASTDKAARLAALETERQRGVPKTVALR